MKNKNKKPISIEELTQEELDKELEKGYQAALNGEGIPAEEFFKEFDNIMTKEQFDEEIEKGYQDVLVGNLIPAKEAYKRIEKELNIIDKQNAKKCKKLQKLPRK